MNTQPNTSVNPDYHNQVVGALTKMGENPTPEQLAMILDPGPSLRVIAGAGSGKTTTLILRVIIQTKLLNIPLASIHVFSFTRASTFEFRTKLAEKLAVWEEKVEGANVSDNRKTELLAEAKQTVSTFHSVIARTARNISSIGPRANFFDLFGSPKEEETLESFNPFLASRLSAPQLEILRSTHEELFHSDSSYADVLYDLQNIDDERYWKTRDLSTTTLKSETEPQFWNYFLRDEKEYHGITNHTRKKDKGPVSYFDDRGTKHVDPYRAAVASFLTKHMIKYSLMTSFRVQCPIRGREGDTGTLFSSFKIKRIYLHIERHINPYEEKRMFFQQRDRRKFIAIYCDSFQDHKALTVYDFEKDKETDEVFLTEEAASKIARWIGIDGLPILQEISPIIRLRIAGNFRRLNVFELLYQEGVFIESLGLEVQNLHPPLLQLGINKKEVSLVLSAIVKYWRAFNSTLENKGFTRFHSVLSQLRDEAVLSQNIGNLEPLRHLFIDEFQDISPELVDWLTKVSSTLQKRDSVSVTGIGDDFQAIYGWRGSHPQFILNWEQYFSSDKSSSLELTTNFRSRSSIIEAAEEVLSDVMSKYPKYSISSIPANVENNLPYPIQLKVLEYDHNLSELWEKLWDYFCNHVVSIIRSIRKNRFESKLFRDPSSISILILARKNETIGKAPRIMSLRKRFIDYCKESGLGEFEKVNITSLTFHRAKGLEADFTLLLDDCIKPEEYPLRDYVYEESELQGSYTELQDDEAMRLAYVALTRAKLGLLWALFPDPNSNDSPIRADGAFDKVSRFVEKKREYLEQSRKL